MEIIPVIDIKDGIAVAAKKGERDKYKSLKSLICESPEPLKVAQSYKTFGFSRVYVADLDGILHSKPNIAILKKINEVIPVIADVGIKGSQDARLLKSIENIEIVIGTETLPSIDFLHEILDENNGFNFNDFVLSIDIKNGELMNNLDLDLTGFIEKINDEKIKNKIDKVIVLDLSQVGTSEGPNIGLCKKVVKKMGEKKIIYGGGIRDISDIQKLKGAGICAVLVGTAIHSGKIKIADLKG